jgi:hypothetical protein
MDCPGCGSAVSEGQDVCPQCGVGIPRDESAALSLPVEPADVVRVELPPFFAVSLWKLAVLSVCTLGFYELYWFYRNWQRIRVREQKDFSPAVRVFFALIFCYPCFRRIRRYGVAMGLAGRPPIILLALAWVMVKIAGAFPMPLALISLSGFMLLLPVQAYANTINAEMVPMHDRNARFTLANWGWILVGSCLLLLSLIAMFLPPGPVNPV